MNKDEYYVSIADAVSKRGTCARRNYGAVIVRDDQIISTGYNGAARGAINCIRVSGECPRRKSGKKQGKGYDACRAVHAELNAIIHAGRRQTLKSTLYLAGREVIVGEMTEDPMPCVQCQRAIINAGIVRVVTRSRDGAIVSVSVEEWIRSEEDLVVGWAEQRGAASNDDGGGNEE